MSTREGSRHAPLRDVLAGLYNLETLLRSPRAANDLILGVLPELARGARTLLAAFEGLPEGPGCAELSSFARTRVDAVCASIAEVPRTLHPRARLLLLGKVMAARPDLAIAVDLLSVLELAGAPETTDLDLGEASRVAFAKGKDPRLLDVRVESVHGSIVYDARILTFLLREAAVASRTNETLVVRAAAEPETERAVFTFAGAGALLGPSPASEADALRAVIFGVVLAKLGGEHQRGGRSRLLVSPMKR